MSAATSTIDVGDLRVGMFVHLDVGWMAHPFPLSSFRISSGDQIATIRRLGVSRVRWSPEDSRPEAPASTTPGASAETGPSAGSAAAADTLATETPAERARRERREALAAQRSSLALVERQYVEASRAWRSATDLVEHDPVQAREQAEGLSRALVEKMLGARELCIHALTGGAGERTTTHAVNVGVLSLLMGRVCAMPEDELLDLGTGSLLHDIGKIDLPARLRQLDEGFTAAELHLYRDHVSHGVSHGRRMGLAPAALLVIAQHHEQADGSGYPQRLSAERMTAAARIVALVNRYDNLCNPAVPARALTPHEALSLLFAQGKHKFDLAVLNTFIRMMGVYPPGSVIQLTDDRHALVTSVNPARPLKPSVLVHDTAVPADEALHLDLETTPGLAIRRSLKPSQLPPAALAYLAPRPRVTYFFEVVEPSGNAAAAEDGAA